MASPLGLSFWGWTVLHKSAPSGGRGGQWIAVCQHGWWTELSLQAKVSTCVHGSTLHGRKEQGVCQTTVQGPVLSMLPLFKVEIQGLWKIQIWICSSRSLWKYICQGRRRQNSVSNSLLTYWMNCKFSTNDYGGIRLNSPGGLDVHLLLSEHLCESHFSRCSHPIPQCPRHLPNGAFQVS